MITKPAEVLLVQRLMGDAKAAVHRTAFVARKGGQSLQIECKAISSMNRKRHVRRHQLSLGTHVFQ
jgi:hypothetical protein